MIGIYKITSPSKKVYIGQSVNIEMRFRHYLGLHNCKGQTILYNSFLKHGVSKHNFEILCECEILELNDKERYYQELYSAIGSKGMNCKITKSNDRSGYFCEETKYKMSKANSINRLGKKHSEETKKKLSEISKINVVGRIHSEETKRKIGLAHIGNKHSLGNIMSEKNKDELIKRNIGNKYNLGKKVSEESKRKISESLKGNKHCLGRNIVQCTRDKISESNKGKKRTDEVKLKLAEIKTKIILDTQTGVFLFGIKEASQYSMIEKSSLTKKLNGRNINNTNLIYV